MADAPQKVIVQAARLDASMLPKGLSTAYWQYLILQGQDLNNIANASNEANQLAYQATVKNQQQDTTLTNHEGRISGLRTDVDSQGAQIGQNTTDISSLGTRVTNAETRIGTAEGNISSLQGDYVSKSATAQQSLSSSLDVVASYSVNGTKVVGPRRTGWTASTGNSLLGAFDSNLSQSVSATYVPAEVVAINANLVAARRRIKALEDAMRAHGLIDG
ncbi:phage tail protein [Cronobacter dublinensis]|uniref:phage tail protein n=1 Tax=Cronobacter dublinensis TaxID=413497 RepID=UPI000CFD7352|nr:phage tail protein [Cronobacter dublinensis]